MATLSSSALVPQLFQVSSRSRTGWAWCTTVAAMVILGGGNWTMPLPRIPAEFCAIGLLVAALGSSASHFPVRLLAEDKLVIAVLALGIFQIVPLPPELWTGLPERGFARAIDIAAYGAPVWRTFSLDPSATMRTLVTLIPFAGTYLAARTGTPQRTCALLDGILLAAIATIAVALAQLFAPDANWLHFYPRGDYAFPVGLFTNHNHQALFLLATLPLAAIRAREAAGHIGRSSAGLWLGSYALVALLMALATASRAGASLAPLALFGTTIAWFDGQAGILLRKRRLAGPLALGAIAALATAAIGAELIGGAFNRGALASDQRWQFWPDVSAAASAYWPAGAGIGTFIEAYGRLEPLRAVSSSVLNHAHNEYLEIALEAGLAGVALSALTLGLLARASWQAWRARDGRAVRFVARAATLPLILIALHSVVDYPMRTFAVAALAALSWALQAQARAELSSSPAA